MAGLTRIILRKATNSTTNCFRNTCLAVQNYRVHHTGRQPKSKSNPKRTVNLRDQALQPDPRHITDVEFYQGAHDCVLCHNSPRRATSSRQSRDSSSDDDHKPSLRRQNAIRRHRSPTPARPKLQSGMLSKQQE